MKKALWIINPCSGKSSARSGLLDALALFGQAGIEPTVHVTRARGDATETARTAQGYDMLVCCGGDGTLNEVINGLLDRAESLPLGYIPSGTTNDFASSLGLPRSFVQAARAVVEGEEQPVDIGSMNGRRFSYIASFGAFTKASYSTSQKSKNALGHMAYILEGARELSTLKPIRMRVRAGGETFEEDYIFGAVSNSTSVAGLLKLSPQEVDFADGRFEVLLIRQPKKNSDLYAILQCLSRKKYNSEYIRFFRADGIEFTSPEPVSWTLDGEFGGAVTQTMIHVLPRAVRMILPKK